MDRQKLAITRLPSLLEFFGYMYCFTCLLVGPAFEYKDYITACDGSAYLKEAVDKKEGKGSLNDAPIKVCPSHVKFSMPLKMPNLPEL